MTSHPNLNTKLWKTSAQAQHYIEIAVKALKGVDDACNTQELTLLVGSLFSPQELAAKTCDNWVQSSLNFTNHECSQNEVLRLAADAAFLPFSDNSFSRVMLPHVLEGSDFPHQILREAHRVLKPEGSLILTGFNPYSLLGMQRKAGIVTPLGKQYYSLRRVKDWIQLLGLELKASEMYYYTPLIKNARIRSGLNFINALGDRWLPMFGGAYIISAKKRQSGAGLVGRVKFTSLPTPKTAAAAARKSAIPSCESAMPTLSEE